MAKSISHSFVLEKTTKMNVSNTANVSELTARYQCSNCGKNYVHANLYSDNGVQGFCTSCFHTVFNDLTEEEKTRHEELKVQRGKEQQKEARNKNKNKHGGKTLDQHLYDIAMDPRVRSVRVTEDGLLTILHNFVPDVLELLNTQGYSFDEKSLIKTLRTQYGAQPDNMMCMEGRGPDDPGRTRLLPNWRDMALWFDQYDLEENGGVPKFGMSEHYKELCANSKAKAAEKKKKAKEAEKKKKTKEAAAKRASGKKKRKKRSSTTKVSDEKENNIPNEEDESSDEEEDYIHSESSDEEEDDRKPAAKRSKKAKHPMTYNDDDDEDWVPPN